MSMVTARITRMERAENTPSGNPRWRVHAATPDLSLIWIPAADSTIASALHDDYVGREIELDTKAGNVIVTPAFPQITEQES